MTTYAQIRDGRAVNVVSGSDLSNAIDGVFNAQWVANEIAAGRSWITIPDTDTNGFPIITGAVDNGNGTYTNPAPTGNPRILSATEFNKYGWARLGMATFQGILESVRGSTAVTTDAAKEARAVVQQYDSAQTFSKAEVAALGVKLIAGGFMNQSQVSSIVDNWPTG